MAVFIILIFISLITTGQTNNSLELYQPTNCSASCNGSVIQDAIENCTMYYLYTKDSAVRITISSTNPSLQSPVLIVTKRRELLQSWSLPHVIQTVERTFSYSTVSHTLCPEEDDGSRHSLNIIIIKYPAPHQNISIFHWNMKVLTNFTVSSGEIYNTSVSPSMPQYYKYTFGESEHRVTVLITSSDDLCARVSVQEAKCPVFDMMSDYSHQAQTETILKKGAITVDKRANSDSVFIVFIVSPTREMCGIKSTSDSLNSQGADVKNMHFKIEKSLPLKTYYYVIGIGIGGSILFSLTVCLVYWFCCFKPPEIATEDELDEPSIYADGGSHQVPAAPAMPDSGLLEDETESSSPDEEIVEVACLCCKIITRHLEETTTNEHQQFRQKYMLYLWMTIVVGILYALPAVQLVLTYQKVLNYSGEEDLCYYNFWCARRLGILHNFNNIFSNYGYVFLGLLFIVITGIRHWKTYRWNEKVKLEYGVPHFSGLNFAMGSALMMEGVMSASYHICPSWNNYQFDTAFMYILSGLLMLKLYQSRHPATDISAHTAYLCTAAVLILALFAVMHQDSWAFRVVFFLFHVIFVLYISLQMYADDAECESFKDKLELFFLKWATSAGRKKNLFMWVFLLLVNICNWALSLYIMIANPPGFASYILYIFIMNLALHLGFYIIMKIIHKEFNKQSIVCITYAVMAVGLWAPALWFFTRGLTQWERSPAESRNGNEPCIEGLNFFDAHDIWHFLSAGGLFCSFMTIFHIDDDLKHIPRNHIPVF